MIGLKLNAIKRINLDIYFKNYDRDVCVFVLFLCIVMFVRLYLDNRKAWRVLFIQILQ